MVFIVKPAAIHIYKYTYIQMFLPIRGFLKYELHKLYTFTVCCFISVWNNLCCSVHLIPPTNNWCSINFQYHQYSNPVAMVGTFPRDSRPKDLRLGNGSSTLQKTATDLELNGLAIKERLMANRLPESCV